MAPRTFDAINLVTLPRFTAAGAIALGTSVQTVMAEVGDALPPSCKGAATKCKEALDDLRKAYAARIRAGAATPEEITLLDTELDAAWAALSAVLGAHVRAPFGAEDQVLRDAALRVQKAVFPDGLRFTQLPYKLEWAESQARLDLLEDPALSSDVGAIGGAKFLALVRVKHKAYGDAQGLSKESSPAVESAEVRPRLDRFADALRSYVVKVSATVEDDDDASRALADRLLAPIARWQSTATSAEPTSPGELPVQPAAPATPPIP